MKLIYATVPFHSETADSRWQMVVGLDIGTSCIRVAIGYTDDEGRLKIAGIACKKSDGLRNGNIVNIEAASNAIKKAIENAEQNAGLEVYSCCASIGGAQIEGINAKGKVAVSSKGRIQKEIANEDILRVRESATAVPMTMDREKLHVITQEYIVDGRDGIKDPINQLGVCLEAYVHIITASSTTIGNLRSCINRAGYGVDAIFLKTLASTYSTATEDELELGSIIVDLGAGATDILVFQGGAPICTASVPLGGNSVTNDIAVMMGISIAEAERLKIEYGCCYEENVPPAATVIINGVGGRPPVEIPQSELAQIIRPRMEEIIEMIINKIVEKTTVNQLAGNIILTGAGANMNGIVELFQEMFGTVAVRIGKPRFMGGIEEDYDGPEWSVAVGLVLSYNESVSKQQKGKRKSFSKSNEETPIESSFKSIKKFFKSLF